MSKRKCQIEKTPLAVQPRRKKSRMSKVSLILQCFIRFHYNTHIRFWSFVRRKKYSPRPRRRSIHLFRLPMITGCQKGSVRSRRLLLLCSLVGKRVGLSKWDSFCGISFDFHFIKTLTLKFGLLFVSNTIVSERGGRYSYSDCGWQQDAQEEVSDWEDSSCCAAS